MPISRLSRTGPELAHPGLAHDWPELDSCVSRNAGGDLVRVQKCPVQKWREQKWTVLCSLT